ncbi:hypothetical protein H6F90_00170 [Trichocoleus sp. FACHB-591]|uniref:ADYC domain-containing protein n=1 Tax=Trichocoleus sp. FACHB-591 TaxID=2692872 RepID=UPI001682814F|nr:ADYC domain-containing protein [Trichocoleus sp. FACHB-591]MBD2093569.1 hypothetical protein [Trichocoleus sp. FACHB-591]
MYQSWFGSLFCLAIAINIGIVDFAKSQPNLATPINALAPGSKIIGFDAQGHRLKFQIRSAEVDQQDPQQETYLYTVFYKTKNQTWQNYCRATNHFAAKAIALPGTWDRNGTYQGDENQITFSCLSGALAKCVRLGYKPWQTINGRSLQDYHQACVRMIRADYCGDGTAHTRDGTQINIYDRLGIQKRSVVPGMSFEAAWGSDGARSIHRTRYPEDLAYVQQVCPYRLASNTKTNQMAPIAQSQSPFPTLLFNESAIQQLKRQ